MAMPYLATEVAKLSYTVGLKSNSPFFGTRSEVDRNQDECWNYFCKITGCQKPNEKRSWRCYKIIDAIWVQDKTSPEILGNLLEGIYVNYLNMMIHENQTWGEMTYIGNANSQLVKTSFPSLSLISQRNLVLSLRKYNKGYSVIELYQDNYYLDCGMSFGFEPEKFDYKEKFPNFEGLYRRVEKVADLQ